MHVQNVLAEFVNVELTFHAKALEMYTECYRCLHSQSEDNDLQVSVSLSFSHSLVILSHYFNFLTLGVFGVGISFAPWRPPAKFLPPK